MKDRIVKGYQAKTFPWLMDKNLGSEYIKQERRSILAHAKGEVLEIGIGTGNNLPYYPKHIKNYDTSGHF